MIASQVFSSFSPHSAMWGEIFQDLTIDTGASAREAGVNNLTEVSPYWGMTPAQAMEKMPDPQDRFNYYICVNSYMHPLTQKSDIFFPDAEQSAKVVGSNLVSLTKLNEIFLAIHILTDMHSWKKYDVLSDSQLMKAILDSKKKVHTARQRKEIDESIRWMQSKSLK